ncbi:hypothetical protein [Salinimicrobium xinjiangense]|uniref:hypothetical protein n=1 Tax=Salinimicrobium xinjiangense TaxID=438596 RepID=UPI0004179A7E|nr:hypothetical protein [Salinimicrobium xinjiangense]
MKQGIFKIPVFTGLFLLFLFTSCDNDDRVVNLSENPEAREGVYEQILNDEQLFGEFMNELRENKRSMEWMDNNRPMMNRMYGGERMHNMMRRNPQMRDSMMQGMFNSMERDTSMRTTPQMRQRMLQHMNIMMQRDTAFARRLRQMVQQQSSTAATGR